MRALGCLVVVALALQAVSARELKWDWSSASSLGKLSTATGANTNAGLLSTINAGQGNDGGMLAGGAQTGGLGNANSGDEQEAAQPPLPPGVARPPALPGTPRYARQQAALRRARAPAPAPARAPAPAPAAAPQEAATAQAAAEAPAVYVTYDAVPAQTEAALAPGVAPFGVGAPEARYDFAPLGGPLAQQMPLQRPAVSRIAAGRTENEAPDLAPFSAPVPAPVRAPAPAPLRAPAPAPRPSGPFGRLPNPFRNNGLIWTAG
ncbi:hypothetical protein CVIRNUC_005452 [Coccomyxa viridis]|uniref:Uncharacterized protein n=1 Tax=Coccomyxa viridis TaxID=1274662 RepID=A0AAV1I5A9_9CHLO|nr:hypothetical protein CVIRNUC_005452 [Coccomyxa viridis]